jgi:protocatechuate 3,4-dioxygenase beta subunit
MASSSLLALWEEGQERAAKPTPAEVLGPFFKKGAPNTPRLHKPGDPGFPLRVEGRVLNTRGEKVPGARLDVWHADHAGLYDVQGYRYRARVEVEQSSVYTLETIMPGHYPDRPAQHIHYMITAPGHKTLITQAYFATDPFFEGDPDKNYAKRRIVSDRALVRPVKLFERDTPHAEITFDIILERA